MAWRRSDGQDGSPAPSGAQVQLDVVLKDGDEQHDGEAQQDARVLQHEEAAVAEAVLAGVVVQHLRHLPTQTGRRYSPVGGAKGIGNLTANPNA